MEVYVVYDQYRHEGCSPPEAIFTTLAAAQRYVERLERRYGQEAAWREERPGVWCSGDLADRRYVYSVRRMEVVEEL